MTTFIPVRPVVKKSLFHHKPFVPLDFSQLPSGLGCYFHGLHCRLPYLGAYTILVIVLLPDEMGAFIPTVRDYQC